MIIMAFHYINCIPPVAEFRIHTQIKVVKAMGKKQLKINSVRSAPEKQI